MRCGSSGFSPPRYPNGSSLSHDRVTLQAHVGVGSADWSCAILASFVLVLLLNEMVLLLEDTASSTSTADAEYEYEKAWERT